MNWLDLLAEPASGSDKNEPMYARITAGIKKAIQSGQLAEHSRLPTNRQLATLLNIDRSTVSRAYLELSQSGLIDSHVGRGTFVIGRNGSVNPDAATRGADTSVRGADDSVRGADGSVRGANASVGGADGSIHSADAAVRGAGAAVRGAFASSAVSSINWFEKFSESSRTCLSLISRQPAGPQQGDTISFAGGIPTEEFYPKDQFQRIVSQLLKSEHSDEMFGYSAADGSPYLREQVKKHLLGHGINCGDDELLIVSGSQQGIDLVTNVLIDPGDLVLLEDPSYFWAICNFRARQARCLPVELDNQGIRLDVLESHLSRQKAKLLYVMPSFQNPTGASMSLDRRHKLIELATRYQVPILEDNFVGDLTYGENALPPLRSLPGGKEVVIHQGTFSKALCPGLRLGWLVAPPEVTSRLLLAKRTSDLSTNSIAQIILAKYLEEGLYGKHLEHVRQNYRNRRDSMLDALSRHMSGVSTDKALELTWSKPEGGLFIWAKLPDGLSARELLTFAEMQGVSFSPGDMFFLNDGHTEFLRLCFIQTEESVIEEGIERLARAVRSYFESVARSSLSEISGRARVRNNVLI
jgi:2-aminoadipate transaminase